MANEETLPPVDDARDSGPSEQELLDAVMRNSDIMNEAGYAPPPPAEESLVEDPVESDDEQDPESYETADTEENDEEAEEEGSRD